MMVVTKQTFIPREGHPVSVSHSACGLSSPDAGTDANVAAGSTDISGLLNMLASVPDPRSPRGKQYPLEFVLAVCVVAVLAGAKNYTEIGRQAADMPQPLLRKLGAKWNWFRFRYQWPGKSAIWNVLTKIDAAMMDRITGAWLAAQARRDGEGEWRIALDGKVMRGAWTDENDKVTMFSAMLHDEAVTIAQVRVPDGTNEITQAGTLLDAAGIPEGESVLVTIKGNQPALQRQVFGKMLPLLSGTPGHIMEEHSRGRIKKWSCWLAGADGIDFPYAAQAAFIRRDVFEITGDRISKECALILTSRKAEKMTAAEVSQHARNHWGIENKSHYVRDTVYREDHCQAWAGEGPQALASFRNLAIGLFG